jgi:hypothetical protein
MAEQLTTLRSIQVRERGGNHNPMAMPVPQITAEVSILQINGISLQTFIEQETDGMKDIRLAGAIFTDESVNARLEAELRLHEVAEISDPKFGDMHSVGKPFYLCSLGGGSKEPMTCYRVSGSRSSSCFCAVRGAAKARRSKMPTSGFETTFRMLPEAFISAEQFEHDLIA